ncbi:hypothetical protein D3C81_1245740 [compost metagenome]
MGRRRAGRLARLRQGLDHARTGRADGARAGHGNGGGALRGLPEPVHAPVVLCLPAHARVPGRLQRQPLHRRGGQPGDAPALQRGRARPGRRPEPQRLLRSPRAGAAAPDQRHAEPDRRSRRAARAARPQGQAALRLAGPRAGPAGRPAAPARRHLRAIQRRWTALLRDVAGTHLPPPSRRDGPRAHRGRLGGDLGRRHLHRPRPRLHAGHLAADGVRQPAARRLVAIAAG